MLKLLFLCLLLANGALLAFQQGYLDTIVSDGHEPARLAKQFNVDKIKLVTASAVATMKEPEPSPPGLAQIEHKAEPLACTEIGNFEANDAKRFETQLATLALGDKLSRRTIQDTARHMVFIPSQGSKEAVDKKASELRRLGINDFYVIQDGSNLNFGISLGIFKTEEAARAHLNNLAQKGVHSARVGPHNVASTLVAFQVHGLDAATKGRLDKIKAGFPRQELRSCDAG